VTMGPDVETTNANASARTTPTTMASNNNPMSTRLDKNFNGFFVTWVSLHGYLQ
jgi:hypothetical protein